MVERARTRERYIKNPNLIEKRRNDSKHNDDVILLKAEERDLISTVGTGARLKKKKNHEYFVNP